jgi:hypothetical protein
MTMIPLITWASPRCPQRSGRRLSCNYTLLSAIVENTPAENRRISTICYNIASCKLWMQALRFISSSRIRKWQKHWHRKSSRAANVDRIFGLITLKVIGPVGRHVARGKLPIDLRLRVHLVHGNRILKLFTHFISLKAHNKYHRGRSVKEARRLSTIQLTQVSRAVTLHCTLQN